MSKHTDQTETKIKQLKKNLEYYYQNYEKVTLGLSEVSSRDKDFQEEINRRLDSAKWFASKHGYTLKCEIQTGPVELAGYNCAGCRKRHKGDYYWVGVNGTNFTTGANPSWFNNLVKVCSKECGELMILRLA